MKWVNLYFYQITIIIKFIEVDQLRLTFNDIIIIHFYLFIFKKTSHKNQFNSIGIIILNYINLYFNKLFSKGNVNLTK